MLASASQMFRGVHQEYVLQIADPALSRIEETIVSFPKIARHWLNCRSSKRSARPRAFRDAKGEALPSLRSLSRSGRMLRAIEH